MAEFLALKDGMRLCKALHISPILIQSDSIIVVSTLRLARSENWRFAYVLRDCLQLYTPYFEIVHGFHQKNIVAGRLAAWAYDHRRDRNLLENKTFWILSVLDIEQINWSYGITDREMSFLVFRNNSGRCNSDFWGTLFPCARPQGFNKAPSFLSYE